MDPEALAERKRRLREELRRRCRRLSPAERCDAGLRAARRVLATGEFQAAVRIALYAALPDELPTRALFEQARAVGKQLLLPRASEDDLRFAPLARWEDLRRGALGVLEPPGAATHGPPPDLVLVPGVAYDVRGNRLGRGRGFYDRWLGRWSGPGRRFGLAFDLQLLEAVPHGPADRKVDAVITDRRTVRICGGEGVA